MDLRHNDLGEEGWCAVFDALRDNPQNKIAKWDLFGQGVGPTTSKSLAAYMAVSASLTSLLLGGNRLGPEGAKALAPALAANASLTEVHACRTRPLQNVQVFLGISSACVVHR